MCHPPSDKVIRGMLETVVSPDVSIEKVHAVPSVRPQRIYEITLSDGRSLHLVMPPRSVWRPLRSEDGMVASEAVAVRWIREAASRHATKEQTEPSSPTSSSSTSAYQLPSLPSLLALLPILVHHGRESSLLDSSFAVYSPVPGTPLALVPHQPSSFYSSSSTTTTAASQRRQIDLQLGRLFRALAQLASPAGRFGPVAAVVGTSTSTRTSTPPLRTTTPPMPVTATTAARRPRGEEEEKEGNGGGAGTWSVAFHSLLEGVLRDGEDMAVAMAYSTIRRQFRRLGYLLDRVAVARLVVVEGAGGGNVLVMGVGEGDGKQEWVEEEQKEAEEVGVGAGGDTRGKGAARDEENGIRGEKAEANAAEKQNIVQRQLKVSGLRDWSSCVFGDPLLATVFSDPQQQPPSAAFLEGFNGGEVQHNMDTRARGLPLDETIIDDVDTAWVRLLLYQVYHAVVRIVSEFYRPRPDSSARELEARRKLNEVLARLAEVAPEDAKKRHERPTGEMSPAKRIKADAVCA